MISKEKQIILIGLGGALILLGYWIGWLGKIAMDERDEIQIVVDSNEQMVTVLAGELVLWQAPVSTSAIGLGEEEGSYRTPTGHHRVAERIGDGEPLGAVFVSRRPTGDVWSPGDPPSGKDMVLTRILWLSGEERHNRNSQPRYIYFHGTNHEDKIGEPASQGCIRLRNADMLRLFDFAQVGTPVLIK